MAHPQHLRNTRPPYKGQLPPGADALFRTLPVLQTSRLRLRKVKLDDAHDLYAYAHDPAVSEFVLWEPHTSLLDSHQYLKAMCRKYLAGDVTEWGVVHSEAKRLIGTCGFVGYEPDHFRAEVGYALGRKYWHQGLATEALAAVATFSFETLGLQRLEARTALANAASGRVLEKLGFRQEGVLRAHLYMDGKPTDVVMWGLLAADFAPPAH